MKLEIKISFDATTEDGTDLGWIATPYRLAEGEWVRIIEGKTGKVIYEIQVTELEKLAKMIHLANKTEAQSERI